MTLRGAAQEVAHGMAHEWRHPSMNELMLLLTAAVEAGRPVGDFQTPGPPSAP
jgi:hypothetical protein